MLSFCRSFSSKSKIIHNLTNPRRSILGTVSTDLNGDNYYRFQGIPYAQPPVGNLRFKAPLPIEPWSGILNATKEGSCCYSRHPLQSNKIQGSEDCLYLNVYTKNLGGRILQPVMFWIHGGAFSFGSGGTEFYGPDFLLTEDVVVVTLNYRLGILGFLSLQDPTLEVFGNAGLKDVVMALKWVKNNIEEFGGDPNNVTIFGQSAGGAAVHLLMLTQMGRGLFHKAISMSGCALAPWSRGIKGIERISPLINNNRNEKDVYEKLMRMPVEDLYGIQKKLETIQTYVPSLQRSFVCVAEHPNKDAFLTEEPMDVISQGKFQQVPFIIGHTTAESLTFTLLRRRNWPGFETCEDVIPFTYGCKIGSNESRTIARELRKFYFDNDKLRVTNQERLLMESDLAHVYGIYLTVLNQYKKSKASIYLYRMSINTKLNLFKKLSEIDHPGFAHCDDLNYLFKNFATSKLAPGSREEVAVRKMVKLWTNFAKCGNPTPLTEDPLLPVNWKPVTNEEEMEYLEFGEKLLVSCGSEEFKRCKFLKSLFEEYPSIVANY